ncbi:ATP-binding protein [Salmonella enterica]|nr:ATP-binding protein [Salmonella enterica]
MKNIDVILGKDHLEDISSAKPIPAIKEIIWNAFDSKSLIVKVLFQKCQNTNTIERIIIQDQGDGIPHNNVLSLFGSLGESWKKNAKKMEIVLYMDNSGKDVLKHFLWAK